ncbi:unnamed protein product [Arabidopsis lyrata]|uniref:DUF223 domain-containing protein n=1 Tax=Arabidopsis lyrata subsp. lyrata TaxID=81972 RepID=D7LC11_ARALL|nr:hypothetical protein ARALYDRAFT_901268 [Arabidopsis lyrata subsp. lyrata]CAH8263609.1 unnamed protein product [Arabidopsis lyrata]
MSLMNAPNQNLATYVAFDDLQLGIHAQHVVARIVRMWEVHTEIRTVTDRHVFLGHSLLLLDEKNSATHCFIPASLAEKYNGIFKEGIILQIQGFEVRPCTKHNKITDHPFVIKFNNETTFIVEKESWLKIAKEKFRVHNHAHLVGLANTNLALPGNQTFTIIDLAANSPKIETTCIAKLCEFTSKRVQQDAYFLCQATVVDVLSTYGWNNMTCTTCLGTLEPHQNSLLCSNCQDTNVYTNDRLELQMLQRQPLLAVGNYTDLMMKCLIHANPTAHYVQGVLEYFYYDNTIAGLHFLEKAANAPSPINEAIYLTGMINLCSGEFEIGKKHIDHLLRNTNESVVEECWEKIKTALHGIGILRKQEYINSLWAMMPPYMCNINDMQNTCEKCFHYKLMVKFVFMM